RLDVPQTNIGFATSQYLAAVARERSIAHPVGMLEATHFLASRDVPHPRGAILAAGDGAAAVRRKRGAPDPRRVPLEAADLSAAGEVPQPHGPIFPSGQDLAAVRRKGDV